MAALNRFLPLMAVTFTACKDKEALVEDTGAPDTVEVVPLLFEVTSPTSGGIVNTESVTVEGTFSGPDGASASINGEALGTTGDFSVSTSRGAVPWPSSPLWPILGDARDGADGWVRQRATLIYGDSMSASDPVPDSLAFRLTDNLLDSAEGLVDGLLDLDTLLDPTTPVTTLLGVDVYITSITYASITPSLDFTPLGLSYTIRVEQLEMALLLDYGILGSDDTTLTADAVVVSGNMVVSTDGSGGLTATPQDTLVETDGLELFGITDSIGLVDYLLGDTLAAEVESALVDALDGLLEFQDGLRSLDLSGVQIDSDFTRVVHDDEGMSVYAESQLTLLDGGTLGDRLTTDMGWPGAQGSQTPSGQPYEAGLYLDDDLISAIGASLLSTGLLEQEVSGDLGTLTLNTTLLGNLIAGFDTLPEDLPVTLRTTPTATPVGVPGSDGTITELHMGGLLLDFLTDGDGDGSDEVVMTVVVDALVGLTPGEKDELIGVSLVDSQAALLWTDLGSTPEEVEPGLASLITIAVPTLINDLLSDALAFELDNVGVTVVDGASIDDRAALFITLDLSGLLKDEK